jgi:hypothetical protein
LVGRLLCSILQCAKAGAVSKWGVYPTLLFRAIFNSLVLFFHLLIVSLLYLVLASSCLCPLVRHPLMFCPGRMCLVLSPQQSANRPNVLYVVLFFYFCPVYLYPSDVLLGDILSLRLLTSPVCHFTYCIFVHCASAS